MVERKGIELARKSLIPHHPPTARAAGTPSGTPRRRALLMDCNGRHETTFSGLSPALPFPLPGARA